MLASPTKAFVQEKSGSIKDQDMIQNPRMIRSPHRHITHFYYQPIATRATHLFWLGLISLSLQD
jgi:hypothetical protein